MGYQQVLILLFPLKREIVRHALPRSTHLTSVKPDTLVDNLQPRGTQKDFRCCDLRKDAVAQDLNILKVKSTFKRTKEEGLKNS